MSVLASVPVGPLIGNRSAAASATASLRYVLPGLPSLAIRVEAGGLPASSQANHPPGALDMITNGSRALFAGIGPQVSVPVDRAHFYSTASAGVARVWATSALLLDNPEEHSIGPPSETSSQATNFAWSAGGGFVMPVSSGRSRADVEVGVRYYDLGRATYTTDYGPPCDTVNDRRTPIARSASGSSPISCGAIALSHHRTTFVAPSIGLVWHF